MNGGWAQERSGYHYEFYRVRQGDSISKILFDLYGKPLDPEIPVVDQSNVAQMVDVVLFNNPGITDANRIFPGQLLDVSPFRRPFSERICVVERDKMATLFNGMSQDQIEIVNSDPGLMGNLTLDYYLTGIGGGVAALDGAVDAVEKALNELTKELRKLDTSRGGSISDQIRRIQQHDAIKRQIDQLNTKLRTKLLRSKDPYRLKDYLSRSRKIRSDLKIPNLSNKNVSKYLDRSSRLAKSAKRIVKGVRWGIPIVLGAIDVYRDPGDKVRATVRETVGVAGGYVGGAVAIYATCNLIFGLPSGGTSMIFCSFVAGGVGGVVGSVVGESIGESNYDSLF